MNRNAKPWSPPAGAIAVSLAVLGMLLSDVPAAAQSHDHLHCYKAKDPSSFSALADLRPAEDTVFPLSADCRLKLRSRRLCFAAEKDLLESSAPSLDIVGQDLGNAFVCYKAKCASEDPPASLEVSDQFGTRTFTRLRTKEVCAPAILGSPPVTTTTTTTLPALPPRLCTDAAVPNCDGTCGNFNFACVEDAGACVCSPVDAFAPCGLVAGPPTCWGSCSGTLSCVDVDGTCQCALAF